MAMNAQEEVTYAIFLNYMMRMTLLVFEY